MGCRPASETLQLEADYSRPKRSLFCFSVYTENTGSPKPSTELDLLTAQFARKVSIFTCEKYEVYADVEVSLGEGFLTKKVTDVKGDWHFGKRKETGAWVNTGMFIQVWKAIGDTNAHAGMDWVVKVDPDAVFVPERLRDRIQWLPRTTSELCSRTASMWTMDSSGILRCSLPRRSVSSSAAWTHATRSWIGRWASRMASMVPWARTSSPRSA